MGGYLNQAVSVREHSSQLSISMAQEILELIQDALAKVESASDENAMGQLIASSQELLVDYCSAQHELQDELHKLKGAFDRHEKDYKALKKELAIVVADHDSLLLGQIASKLENELIKHLVSEISVLEKNEDLCYYNLDDIDELIAERSTLLTEEQKRQLKATKETTYRKQDIQFEDCKCIRTWKSDRNKPAHPDLTLTEAKEIVTKSKSIPEREKKKAKKYLKILEDFRVNNLSTKIC